MGFPFINAVVNVHMHATEDEKRVFSALRTLVPESAEVKRSKLKGHHGNPIIGLESRVNHKGAVKELWQRMVAKLRYGEFEKLRAVIYRMVDDSCNVYLRLDKQSAYGGELVLTESGDSIHLRLKAAAFPARREVAVELVKKFVESGE